MGCRYNHVLSRRRLWRKGRNVRWWKNIFFKPKKSKVGHLLCLVVVHGIFLHLNSKDWKFRIFIFQKIYRSAIVTGKESSVWTIFDKDYKCHVLTPVGPGEGIPRYIPSLRDITRFKIYEVAKGCYCPRFCNKKRLTK